MPLIKPRTRGKQLVKHRTRLDRENNETLYAYAHFLGESTEYVLNQVIDTVLARDKEFVTVARATIRGSSRAAHAQRRRTGRTRTAGGVRARGVAVRRTSHRSRQLTREVSAMLRKIVEARVLVAMPWPRAVGLWGLRTYPVSRDDVFLGADRRARVQTCSGVLAYGYATLWFTTPFFAASC